MKQRKEITKPGCENIEVAWLTVDQARKRYNLSRGLLMRLAEEKGAVERCGRAVRICASKFEN